MTLCVLTFTGFYCRIWEKMNGSLSQCIIALFDIHTGITQIPSQLTKKIGMNSSSGHPRLCLCQLSWHFTVEFGRKWMAVCHYSTHWHSYRYYSNSFTVNKKIGMNSSSGHPRLCLCQLSWHFTVEFGRKWMAKSVTMHYSTPWHSYRRYSNSFTVNMTFSIHSSSGHPRLCLC